MVILDVVALPGLHSKEPLAVVDKVEDPLQLLAMDTDGITGVV